MHMEAVLKSIAETPGVGAVYIYSMKKGVLAQVETEALSSKQVEQLLREIGLALTSTSIYGEEICQFDLFLPHRCIFTRRYAGSWLIAICSEHVDLAMLRMALNVAIAELRDQENVFPFLSERTKWTGMNGKSLSEIHNLVSEQA